MSGRPNHHDGPVSDDGPVPGDGPVSGDGRAVGAERSSDAPILVGALRLPDGTWVRGRGLRNPPPSGPAPGFGLYLGSGRLRRRHDATIPWPHEWIEWPDFLLPRDRALAARSIRALHARARAGEAVEVACGGGIGRTGTVIACLAVLSGLDPAAAIAWTRENHDRRAIETPWQRRWVARFPTL